MGGFRLAKVRYIPVSIATRKVQYKDKYLFDIVLSTEEKLTQTRIVESEMVKMEPEIDRQDATTMNREIMLMLLRDIHSVDLCFVFESDKACSNMGLWAHRVILSRYNGFENAIQMACKDLSSASEDMASLTIGDGDSSKSSTTKRDADILGPLLIPIKKFNLATFCVLLRYIYTGEVRLSVEADKHTLSTNESTLVVESIVSKRKESVRWHPLGSDSPWKFKDVTWGELLLAADFYGVKDLRLLSEKKVISAISKSTVVETLFTIGTQFDKIKGFALDYIVDDMAALFPKGENPFAPYKNHPEYDEMLVELIHRKANL
ncbi:hypothetical protein BGX27_000140 [Mortierella sp. AM989]|nr:hypothetical protein BGX27_000140 [Mortierella sp. AM989]